MIEYCHYVNAGKKGTKQEWAFIPGCMGAAASGPHACTCMSTEERLKRLEDEVLPRLSELSQTVAALENFLDKQFEKDGAELIIVEFDVARARLRETSRTVARATKAWEHDLFEKKLIRKRTDQGAPVGAPDTE